MRAGRSKLDGTSQVGRGWVLLPNRAAVGLWAAPGLHVVFCQSKQLLLMLCTLEGDLLLRVGSAVRRPPCQAHRCPQGLRPQVWAFPVNAACDCGSPIQAQGTCAASQHPCHSAPHRHRLGGTDLLLHERFLLRCMSQTSGIRLRPAIPLSGVVSFGGVLAVFEHLMAYSEAARLAAAIACARTSAGMKNTHDSSFSASTSACDTSMLESCWREFPTSKPQVCT